MSERGPPDDSSPLSQISFKGSSDLGRKIECAGKSVTEVALPVVVVAILQFFVFSTASVDSGVVTSMGFSFPVKLGAAVAAMHRSRGITASVAAMHRSRGITASVAAMHRSRGITASVWLIFGTIPVGSGGE